MCRALHEQLRRLGAAVEDECGSPKRCRIGEAQNPGTPERGKDETMPDVWHVVRTAGENVKMRPVPSTTLDLPGNAAPALVEVREAARAC